MVNIFHYGYAIKQLILCTSIIDYTHTTCIIHIY